MQKTYFNSAVTGNSRMLVCLSELGELVRLFWPDIDYIQQIDKFMVGIFDIPKGNNTLWLSNENFSINQYYIDDTNIIATEYISPKLKVKIRQVDFCLMDEDVLFRHYEIANTGSECLLPGIMCYSKGISSTCNPGGIMFDMHTDSLVHYRHEGCLSVSGSVAALSFQLGDNAFESAGYNMLNGINDTGMMQDGAVSWKPGVLGPGGSVTFTLTLCLSPDLNEIGNILSRVKRKSIQDHITDVKNYWMDYLKGLNIITSGVGQYDRIYKRSLLLFKLMSNQKSGGIIAAPEMDENFTRCGRYGYCWGRDAAFITSAMDICGLLHLVDNFFNWAKKTQNPDGSWHQRYYTNGRMAPSWGLQVDETGAVIWGIYQHYIVTESETFLRDMWAAVKKGVEFLVNFVDSETGLPAPSYDLWEERYGEHLYSTAAVYGGIMAGACIAGVLKEDEKLSEKWISIAMSIRDAALRNFWKDGNGRFIRSVRVKLNPWGPEYGGGTVNIQVNAKGVCRQVTKEDWTADASILGVAIPFGMLDTNDPRVESSVEKAESVLKTYRGGLKRYENDNYIGGNPWVLTTLWFALYYIRNGKINKALEYFDWAARGATPLGFLPEQIDINTGKPAWVIPLTWSHAMFVLVMAELFKAGAWPKESSENN